MSTITSNAGAVPAGEPKPIIPPLASFYLHARDLGWLVVRLTAGGMLLVHGIMKIMPMTERGFAATIEAFAAGSLARRGIEPAIVLAYVVFFIETIGAVLIILGLFTRFIAAAAAIEFAIITFLHVVLGELVPKNLAIAAPERVALWVAIPIRAFMGPSTGSCATTRRVSRIDHWTGDSHRHSRRSTASYDSAIAT